MSIPPRFLPASLLLLAWADIASAQVAPPPALFEDSLEAGGAPALHAGRAFVYSIVLPGAAQYRLGEVRWLPYAGLELWGWLRYVDRHTEGFDLERRYRDLAWRVARRGVAPRRDGGFAYYEAVGKFAASGAFDTDPDRGGIQPELDEATYNGSIWALARAIHLPAGRESAVEDGPEYRRAIEYYRQRAIPQDYAWAWDANLAAQNVYTELMHRSDEALRSATRTLGLILANHLVSAVDALIAARLRATDHAEPPVRLDSAVEMRGDQPGWVAVVEISWPRR